MGAGAGEVEEEGEGDAMFLLCEGHVSLDEDVLSQFWKCLGIEERVVLFDLTYPVERVTSSLQYS